MGHQPGIPKSEPWTPQDLRRLQQLHAKYGIERCVKAFPGRTRAAILTRASKLKHDTRVKSGAAAVERTVEPMHQPIEETQRVEEWMRLADPGCMLGCSGDGYTLTDGVAPVRVRCPCTLATKPHSRRMPSWRITARIGEMMDLA